MGDLGKFIADKGFKKLPNKSQNLVTLLPVYLRLVFIAILHF